MEEGPKKISFGFSKLSKKTSIISSQHSKNTKPERNDVEFIEGFESNSIKLKDPIKNEDKVLVIPLKPTSEVAVVQHFPTQNVSRSDESSLDKLSETCIPNDNSSHVIGSISNIVISDDKDLKNPTLEGKPLTLDELAAKEILDDLNEEKTKTEAKVISVPLSQVSTGEKESTLDDYENVPVGEFGVAMLRGMGWAPGKGIGKNEKLVAPSLPPVRPKGMGLGADKVIQMPNSDRSKTDTEDALKMVVGSFIKVIAGQNKNCYGKIEAFDEESGRTIVKLAVNNLTVSLNEFMFQLVNKKEYIEKSKIVNLGKYEQYKKSEENESLKNMQSKHNGRSKSPDETKAYNNNSSSQSVSSSRNSHPSSTRHGKSKADKKEKKYRGRSSSSDKSSSSSSSDYSRRNHRIKKKKPSSHRLKSRSRSRSPRKHKKDKKR